MTMILERKERKVNSMINQTDCLEATSRLHCRDRTLKQSMASDCIEETTELGEAEAAK